MENGVHCVARNGSISVVPRPDRRLPAREVVVTLSNVTLDQVLSCFVRRVQAEEAYRGFNALRILAALEAAVERLINVEVANARLHGSSWQSIGDDLGITRQTAIKKYDVVKPTGERLPRTRERDWAVRGAEVMPVNGSLPRQERLPG